MNKDKTYVRIDAGNIAKISTLEKREILNLEGLQDQKAELTELYNEKLAEIQENIDKFEELD